MEAEHGSELFDFIAAGPLPENMARMYFQKLMAGIEHMHWHGVYHRDLKLENILLSENLELKIAGFEFSISQD
jgi:serine/threonine protein kinase